MASNPRIAAKKETKLPEQSNKIALPKTARIPNTKEVIARDFPWLSETSLASSRSAQAGFQGLQQGEILNIVPLFIKKGTHATGMRLK